MEILKWIGMILGILLLLYMSVKMLLNSEEKLHTSTRSYQRNKKQIEEMHKHLDDSLIALKNQNGMLEKVSAFFTKLNTQVFKK